MKKKLLINYFEFYCPFLDTLLFRKLEICVIIFILLLDVDMALGFDLSVSPVDCSVIEFP